MENETSPQLQPKCLIIIYLQLKQFPVSCMGGGGGGDNFNLEYLCGGTQSSKQGPSQKGMA